MTIRVFSKKGAMAGAAAAQAAARIKAAIAAHGRARVIAATGMAQFEFLSALTSSPGISWKDVEVFHLDEYIALPETHPASFRRFLAERLVRPAGVGVFHGLDGNADPERVCREVGARLAAAPVDIAFVGIGENAHLAFNDPPADFDTDRPYLVVTLDAACRRQQVGEGWFPHLDAVPTQAISMSCRQVLKAGEILCLAPDLRKASAVRATLEGDVIPRVPASILRTHPNVTFYLDEASASHLTTRPPTEDAAVGTSA